MQKPKPHKLPKLPPEILAEYREYQRRYRLSNPEKVKRWKQKELGKRKAARAAARAAQQEGGNEK